MSSQKETNGATWYYRMHPVLSLLSLSAIFGQSNMESPPPPSMEFERKHGFGGQLVLINKSKLIS